jgi:diadenosine tetraphosphate (Ap4A) HIT family hydrolase
MNTTTPTAIHRMVEACRKGDYELLIARMPSGWAIMGGSQFLNGYSLLLPDPVAPHLNAMEPTHRDQFLKDMAALGDAVLAATGAVRINYAMFGNTEPALHAHIIPRYANEAPELRTAHPWTYDWDAAIPFSLSVHGELLKKLRSKLKIS